MPHLRIIPVCLVLALAGCQPQRDVTLLHVSSIEPHWIEPNVDVRIGGEGFPVGRAVMVRLDGRVHRPAAASRQVHVTVEGSTVSSESATFTATPALVTAVGGRATFVGSVRLLFAMARGTGTVSGVLHHVRVDFAPDAPARLASETALEHAASAWLARVGIGIDEEDMGPGTGVQVVSVAPSGAASAAGIRRGDLIVGLDGLRPAALSDLAPRPGASAVTVVVRRDPDDGPLQFELPGPSPVRHRPAALPWVVAALLALLAFTGPTARPVMRTMRAIERVVVVGPAPGSLHRQLARVVLVAIAVAVAWAEGAAGGDTRTMWAAYLACASAAWLLGARRPAGLRHLGRLVAPFAFVVCMAVPAMFDVAGRGWPLAFVHPVTFAAFVCALRAAFGAREHSGARSPAMWLEQAARAIAAVLVVDRFLGHGALLAASGTGAARLAAEAVVLAVVASAVQRHLPPARPTVLAAVAFVVLPGAAWLCASLLPAPSLAAVFAPGAAAVCAAVIVAGVWRGMRARVAGARPVELRLHPFL